ncbi:MAG: hypothetical protein PWR30_561 [Candidatus Woesearchaeota archaeon]|nr:hypothetical protein [Candidatus Woesearchaeota archaeon]
MAENEESEEGMKLGGNIELIGFGDFDRSELAVVKKIVGNYVRKFSDMKKGLSSARLRVKTIHEREKSAVYEVNLQLVFDEGKPVVTNSSGRNLFFVVSDVLKSAEELLSS